MVINNHKFFINFFLQSFFFLVIKQWYNFPKHDKWFNNKEISMFDNRLLHEINERWIIDTVNSNNNYSGLEMPEIYDPSMGQSQVIKKIFGYKVMTHYCHNYYSFFLF